MAQVEFYTRAGKTFATLRDPNAVYAEYRLDGETWTFLPTCPVMGWMLDGDGTLEPYTGVVPVPPPTYAEAAR